MSETMDDDWTPVMHEAAPSPGIKVREHQREAPKPRAQPEPEAAPAERPTGAAMSLPLALMLPQEVLSRVDAVVGNLQGAAKIMQDTAQSLDEGMAVLADLSAKDEVEDLRESMSAAHTSLADALAAMGARHDAAAKQMVDAVQGLARQVQALVGVVDANSKAVAHVQSALLAPRRVVLERDKDGFATAAVSEPQTMQ